MRKNGLKIVALLLSAVFVFAVFPSLRSNAYDLTYNFESSAGLLTITGMGEITKDGINDAVGNNTLRNVCIDVANGSIGHDAFEGKNQIKTVTISKGITSIGAGAFVNCNAINSITIPDSVTSIGNFVFTGCNHLTSIEIPNSVNSIGICAFMGCIGLTSITIPNSVTSISDNAFYKCTGLNSITIPDSVTSIGKGAFSGCTNLTSIKIPSGVTSIGESAFSDCTNLTSITIPSGVTSIGNGAFTGCTNLTSITIPSGVTSIGESAFAGCTNLTSIKIPSGVTSIGNGAFTGCDGLTSVVIDRDLYDKYYDDVFMYFPDDATFSFYFYVTYTTIGNGSISGNYQPFGKEKLTVEPYDNYFIDEIIFDYDGNNETILEPDENGDYYMPYLGDTVTDRNVEVRACFKPVQKTVVFYDEDGTTVLQSGPCNYGSAPVYSGDLPTKAEDQQYTYAFAGWTDGTATYDPTATLPAVTGDVNYTAVYESTTKKYTVTFVDGNGKEIQSSDFEYGNIPSYMGDTPTKDDDQQYTYVFAGWTDGTATYDTIATLPAVTGNVNYTAIYESTTKKYTVKFVDDNGNVLQSSEVEYGKSPSFNGTLPTKADTDQYTYKFAEWSDGKLTYFPEETLPAVTGPVTYTAVFDATKIEQQKAVDPVVEPDIRPAADTAVQKPGVYYLNSLTGDGVTTDVVATIKRTEDDVHCVEYFGNAEVDGTPMTVGEQILVGSGSTIITIKKEFLATLGEGTHTLKVLFTDGGSITIEFTVKAAANNGASVPSTGETIGMTTVLGACLILGACGVVVAFAMKKRKDET